MLRAPIRQLHRVRAVACRPLGRAQRRALSVGPGRGGEEREPQKHPRVLITGGLGQLGTGLARVLRWALTAHELRLHCNGLSHPHVTVLEWDFARQIFNPISALCAENPQNNKPLLSRHPLRKLSLHYLYIFLLHPLLHFPCRNRYGSDNVILSDIVKPKNKKTLQGTWECVIHYVLATILTLKPLLYKVKT